MSVYNITVLGGGAVGKSAITVQLVSGHFLNIYDPTIEDSYRTSIVVDDKLVGLVILDTAGQEEYTALRDQYMRAGDGFIIVYSITSTVSFIEANEFREQLYRVLDKDPIEATVPIVLVGNKIDLEADRQVAKEDVERMAEDWHIPFFEASAKTRYNVLEAFQEIVRRIIDITNKPLIIPTEKELEPRRRSGSKLIKCKYL